MRKSYFIAAVLLFTGSACSSGLGSASQTTEEAPAPIRVAHFPEWPLPIHAGQQDGSFAEAVGSPIEWVELPDGNAMTESLQSGEIDIAYSQGLTPFANAVNAGQDLKMIGIAVSYAEADNCVANEDLGITPENAAEIVPSLKIMTPIGNVTHYKFLKVMESFDVDIQTLDIEAAEDGATTAAAFANDEVQIGCSFGGSIETMLDSGGELLMTGEEQTSTLGLKTFDIISTSTQFAEKNPDALTAFLRATQEFVTAWESDPQGFNGPIAEAAGMEDVGNFLAGDVWFSFPTLEEQLSEDWLGGEVSRLMEEQLETFVEVGEINQVTANFNESIDTQFLTAALDEK